MYPSGSHQSLELHPLGSGMTKKNTSPRRSPWAVKSPCRLWTVSFADAGHVAACDYVGMVSANEVPDKLARAGFTVTRSARVDAPLIDQLPVALECELVKFNEDGNVVGRIVNVSADESVLGAEGLIDPAKLRPIAFDPVNNGYLVLGERVGSAFSDGGKIG